MMKQHYHTHLTKISPCPISLMLTLGNTYILYYICPLHTFFFLLVYAIMAIAPQDHHCTITAPSLHHHCTITVPGTDCISFQTFNRRTK